MTCEAGPSVVLLPGPAATPVVGRLEAGADPQDGGRALPLCVLQEAHHTGPGVSAGRGQLGRWGLGVTQRLQAGVRAVLGAEWK